MLVQLSLGALGIGLISLPIILWVRSLCRRRGSARLPSGFTDDMRLALPPGVTHEGIAAFVIENALRSVPDDETERQLVRDYALSADDAAQVRDRVFGGVFRAVLAIGGNTGNEPSPARDPLAFAGYQRVRSEPEVGRRIYPQLAAAPPSQ